MPSPFPGMNPYLEQDDIWHDFHERWIPLAAELLTPQVRPHYIVRLDEHIFVHELGADERRLLGRADVAVTQARPPKEDEAATAVLEAPAVGHLPTAVDLEHLSFIEIRDRRNRELITAIELLSPANKQPGPNRAQYLAKRRQLLDSPVHLVEIDLLRGGPRMPLEEPTTSDYCVLVSRAEIRPAVGLWPIQLRDPLPVIPIPLRAEEHFARIDLQAVLHRIYDAAGYEDYIYTGTPQPPLSADDAAWAQQLVPPRA
jgi:hypothetical protein